MSGVYEAHCMFIKKGVMFGVWIHVHGWKEAKVTGGERGYMSVTANGYSILFWLARELNMTDWDLPDALIMIKFPSSSFGASRVG